MQSKEKKKVDTLQRKGRAESEHESKMRVFSPPFIKTAKLEKVEQLVSILFGI